NGPGCSFGCHHSLRAERKNHGHRVGHQLSGQSRQPVEATIGRAIFNRNVATFDIASLLQALPNGAEHSIIELSAGKQADQLHAGLLRPCRERPRDCRAAEQRDELAPPCMTGKEHTERWRGSVHETASVATGSPQPLWTLVRE